MTTIQIGSRSVAGEYDPLERTQWIWADGVPIFGAPSDWTPDHVADCAAEKGLPRDEVRAAITAWRAALEGARALQAQADRIEAEVRRARAQAEAALEELRAASWRIRERQLKCDHAPQTSRTVGYTGGSPGCDDDRRAAGGVTHIDTCRCGAERYTDSNGCHSDVGRWLLEVPPQ